MKMLNAYFYSALFMLFVSQCVVVYLARENFIQARQINNYQVMLYALPIDRRSPEGIKK